MILGVFADAAVSAFLFGRKFAETAGQREINAALSEACGVPYGREDVPGVFIGAWCGAVDSKNTDGFLRNSFIPKEKIKSFCL